VSRIQVQAHLVPWIFLIVYSKAKLRNWQLTSLFQTILNTKRLKSQKKCLISDSGRYRIMQNIIENIHENHASFLKHISRYRREGKCIVCMDQTYHSLACIKRTNRACVDQYSKANGQL
jgi:hypothetical protein